MCYLLSFSFFKWAFGGIHTQINHGKTFWKKKKVPEQLWIQNVSVGAHTNPLSCLHLLTRVPQDIYIIHYWCNFLILWGTKYIYDNMITNTSQYIKHKSIYQYVHISRVICSIWLHTYVYTYIYIYICIDVIMCVSMLYHYVNIVMYKNAIYNIEYW